MYVVDNAKPELKIVYPIDFKMPQFGKFVVAGVAKDDVGLTKLEWEFGPDKGEFELVPGNPYWGIVLDSTKIKVASIWKTTNDPFARKIRYEELSKKAEERSAQYSNRGS